eukprot:353260-Lingulodinium_polyedra.AAC.1
MVPEFKGSMLNSHPLWLTFYRVPRVHLSWPRAQIPNLSKLATQYEDACKAKPYSSTDSFSIVPRTNLYSY